MNENSREIAVLGVCGLIAAAVAICLAYFGNPANMAICIACFLRDTAGGMKLQTTPVVQYIRPEIMGIVLGACVMAFAGKEFKPSAGSSPAIRFALGFCMMIGCLIFLGCPLRMVLRMAGGDLNAWVALPGFALGIATGVFFLKKGFSLGKSSNEGTSSFEGLVFPVIMLVIFVLSVTTTIFAASTEGPGSIHAPAVVSIIAGLAFGAMAQKSRLCFAGGLRDVFLTRSGRGLIIIGILFVGMLVYNLVVGSFKVSFADQPIAHTNALYNILGMYIVGLSASLLGGCPLRQLILSGQGSSDAAVTVVGLIVGAAFAQNFGIASSAAGVTVAGQIATFVSLAVLFIIAIVGLKKKEA